MSRALAILICGFDAHRLLPDLKGGRFVTSFGVRKRKVGVAVIRRANFGKKKLPGRIDMSGTKKTIPTGNLQECVNTL